MLLYIHFYYNIFYLFVDSLTSYCVILNNSNIKFNNSLLRTYLMVKIIILLQYNEIVQFSSNVEGL